MDAHDYIKIGGLIPASTAVFLCDLQEKFRPVMLHYAEVIKTASKLVQAAAILDVPVIATEQYPSGLGKTCSEIDVGRTVGVFPKTKFSMVLPEVEKAMTGLCGGQLKIAILFGVEAHVCVEQTAIDLMGKGVQVHIVADATTSRSQEDRLLAFERLKQIGCFITTAENIIFKLLGDKDHPKFNEIRPLIKNPTTETGLYSKMCSMENMLGFSGDSSTPSWKHKIDLVESILITLMMKGHLRKPVQKLLLALKSSLEKQMTTGDLQREAKGQKTNRNNTGAEVMVSSPAASEAPEQNLPRKKDSTKNHPTRCSVCGKSYNRHQDLKRHLKTHSQSSDYLCELCGKSFRSREGLGYHTSINHAALAVQIGDGDADNDKLTCSECSKQCSTLHQLKVHLKNSHQRAKANYPCSVCGKSFQRRDVFQSHQKLHSGIRPHSCTQCGKIFSTKSNLNIHQRVHDSRLQVQCGKCCKKFSSKKKLTLHTSDCMTKIACFLCHWSCSSEQDLLEHTRNAHPADYAIQTVFGDTLENQVDWAQC